MMLSGLPGTNGEAIEAEVFRTVGEALKQLRSGKRAITASGPEGAINVWLDYNDDIRCERMVYRITKAAARFATSIGVGAWLREQLPLIEALKEGE